MVNVFEKDVLLDIMVNIVPLAIIVIFTAMVIVFNPWSGMSLLGAFEQYFLLVIPFGSLALVTYWAARQIEGGEGEVEPAGVGEALEE